MCSELHGGPTEALKLWTCQYSDPINFYMVMYRSKKKKNYN